MLTSYPGEAFERREPVPHSNSAPLYPDAAPAITHAARAAEVATCPGTASAPIAFFATRAARPGNGVGRQTGRK